MSKLSISNEMAQVDTKNRNFWDELDEEDRKKLSPFLIMKYAANVEGNADLQEWYLRSANERANGNLFTLNKHPKMQWLLCSTISPSLGKLRHYWIPSKKREVDVSKKEMIFLANLYPNLKDDELELMVKINSRESLKQLARDHGMSEDEIKNQLGK